MENKLKIGQSFEVVEWLGDLEYRKNDIGFQSLIKNRFTSKFFYMYGKYRSIIAQDKNTKQIGKLTITKLK